MKKRKIILLGLPGVGKGVQGKRIAKHFGITHISMGDVVRKLISGNSQLGDEILKSFGTVWQPLADELATRVATELVINLDSFVLDGFPRNVVQAELMGFRPDVVILFHASEEVCKARALLRGRSDDGAEKFAFRMTTERKRLPELVEHLRSNFVLIEIDANQSEEEVFASVLLALDNLKS